MNEETSYTGKLTDDEIPDNGAVFIFDGETVKLFLVGDMDEGTHKLVHSLYRLVSYCSGDGHEISRRVDGMVGRVN
jgi:hypothetical protein